MIASKYIPYTLPVRSPVIAVCESGSAQVKLSFDATQGITGTSCALKDAKWIDRVLHNGVDKNFLPTSVWHLYSQQRRSERASVRRMAALQSGICRVSFDGLGKC